MTRMQESATATRAELEDMVAEADTGGRKPTGTTRIFIFWTAVAWSLFQIWYASPIPFIKKYSDRITHIHLKDRKLNNGPNRPWGEGDTPIREVLQLMKKEKYPFQATIEFEYQVPEGSDVIKEIAKCVRFCRDALV